MDKKKVKKIIVLIAVICIPIMYSFFYLKSYWDPYGNLKGMKIAMVNLDEGEEGENLGQDLVDGLIEKDVITIVQTTQEEAQIGMEEEEYFAIITIPSNFTQYLNSASTTDKKIATITYSPNQKMNYLASQIIAKVVSATELELQSQVSEKVVDTLAEKLESVPESLGKINDGADEILDGAQSLSDGLNQINNGISTLNNRYTEFDNGVNSAYTGSQTLNNGIAQVNSGAGQLNSGTEQLDSAIAQINQGANTLSTSANAGITQLVNGIRQLSGGAGDLATGANQLQAGAGQLNTSTAAYVAGVNQLNANVAQVLNGIVSYGNANPAVLQDPNIANLYAAASQILSSGAMDALSSNGEALKTGASQVNSGASQVSVGANQVNAGATQLANNTGSLETLANGMATLNSSLGQLQSGSQNLKSGVTSLNSGTDQLQNGSNSLTQGLATLSASSEQVKSALNTLRDGSQTAYSGSLELVDGVQTFKTEVNKGLEEANEELVKLDGLSEFVKNPVEIEEVDYGEVSTYGVAFTPLFISVALWVGALMAYVVLYYDQEKRFKLLGKFADNKFMQCALYFAIAVIQGFVTAFLLKVGLGMEIQNNVLYYGSAILIAITFMSIIQFLILNFGEVGKFIALLLLVLQLASSGGTFPVEIIDEGFQKISPYMPMTYTIKLMKESLIMQRDGVAGNNIGIMLGFAIVCFAITGIVEWIKKIKGKKKVVETTESR